VPRIRGTVTAVSSARISARTWRRITVAARRLAACPLGVGHVEVKAAVRWLDDPLNGVDLTGLCRSGFSWFCNNAGLCRNGKGC
jgi:hypothetical protein